MTKENFSLSKKKLGTLSFLIGEFFLPVMVLKHFKSWGFTDVVKYEGFNFEINVTIKYLEK